jgi:hypothetical protein
MSFFETLHHPLTSLATPEVLMKQTANRYPSQLLCIQPLAFSLKLAPTIPSR